MVKKLSLGITSWPEDERPRERLLTRGSHALTDAELLAILIRVGTQGQSAVELGRELLQCFGSLQEMMAAPIAAWNGIKGLGKAKQAQLLAALELGRRAALPTVREKTIIKSSKQAVDYFSVRLRGLPEEHFRTAFVNRQGRLLDDALIAEGIVDSVRPHMRTIVIKALQTNASALIVAHNHPSGDASPSVADKSLTVDIISACRLIGIKILDHVIVADDNIFSFSDSGLLDVLQLEALSTII
ncbi:MAG: DNA repair protein RadC [Gracilibacteraceae bacterium]|nr:DNA repair protein RadC [Gracilibacteraceae bacterium]